MQTWVTGPTGQIGRRLCVELERAGHEVTAFSRQRFEKSSHYQWVFWDLSGNLFEFHNIAPPDVVFHLAAQTSAYQARQNLPGDVNTNVLGFVGLLDALRKTDSFPHVILTGAATEVGITTGDVVSDSDPDDPRTFYDVGKVTQRLYLKQAALEGWIEGTTLRLPNVYGAVRGDASKDRGFLNLSIRRALLGETLSYYSDGSYIRDFLHVDDVVTALIGAMDHRRLVSGETFLIGTGKGTPIRKALAEIAREVQRVTHRPVDVIDSVPPEGMYDIERRNAIIDSTRFRNLIGWEPHISLEEGIQLTIHAVIDLN